MSTVLNEIELVRAREAQLNEMLREVKLFSRRADAPEDRAALAEIERELLDVEARWRTAGLLNEKEMAPAV